MSHPQPSPDHIIQVGMGFEASKTLLSAVEVGVFTELAKSPADATTLRDRLGLHPRAARDFFDTLVAMGFLRRVDDVYHNTEETGAYLDKGKPSYVHLGSLLEMANARLYGIWSNLTEVLRTGRSQDESKSSELETYDARSTQTRDSSGSLAPMTGMSRTAPFHQRTDAWCVPAETASQLLVGPPCTTDSNKAKVAHQLAMTVDRPGLRDGRDSRVNIHTYRDTRSATRPALAVVKAPPCAG